MKSRLAPIILTGVLIALAFLLFRGKEGGRLAGRSSGSGNERNERPTPEDTVFEMVQAAQKGDTATYLDCFWGPLRTRLEQTRTEMGRQAFAEYLAEGAGAIKGVATIGEPEPVGADMRVQAEMVYEDKNEMQKFDLTERRGKWRISGMENPSRIKTIIPYGSEAYPLTPPARSEGDQDEAAGANP